MSQHKSYDYVHFRRVAPLLYEFTIRHPTKTETPIVMVYQFKSVSAAELAARHYNLLLDKADKLGYRLDGYYLYGPAGQTLPISDVFDLDMSIGHVEQRLSSQLETTNLKPDSNPFSTIQPIS